MLFVLNIDGLTINYITLNDLINKQVIHVELYLNLLILTRLLFVSYSG